MLEAMAMRRRACVIAVVLHQRNMSLAILYGSLEDHSEDSEAESEDLERDLKDPELLQYCKTSAYELTKVIDQLFALQTNTPEIYDKR